MSRLRIEGCVIISADGMLADKHHQMPEELKFPGDQDLFTRLLDEAAVIVHGRNSFEDQPRSPERRRIIVTRSVGAIAQDPANAKAHLWNPAGATFAEACAAASAQTGTALVIGGPDVFAMFLDSYDRFWLSEAPNVHLPGGVPAFSGSNQPPASALMRHGLKPGAAMMLDQEFGVSVTAYSRA